ncbi:hypothetical protein KAT92_02030 [Candidatus Babeliales bacterium]|nr:hypothetical protein [Candidatus Babeliales bacterium]
MKQSTNVVLLGMVGIFCVSMGGGPYTQSVIGEKAPSFKLKKGRDVYSGMVIDEKTQTNATRVCFYNPIDPECREGGDPVGETYLEAFRIDQDANSKIRLKSILAIEILKVADSKFFVSERHNNRRFLRVKVTFVNDPKKPVTRLVDPQIVLGYTEQTGEIVTVLLFKINKIESIKKVGEGVEKKEMAAAVGA